MRVSPCAKKPRESVVAEARAFCRNRPREFRVDPSLPNSHHSSFLEGIVLREPAWWPSGLRPQASARQAGRQAGRQRLLSVGPAPTPTPTPVPSPELLPKSPGLTFARSGGGEGRSGRFIRQGLVQSLHSNAESSPVKSEPLTLPRASL